VGISQFEEANTAGGTGENLKSMKQKHGRQQLGKRQLSEPNGRISRAHYPGKIFLDSGVWSVVVKDHMVGS
jgi:hypothetical protein